MDATNYLVLIPVTSDENFSNVFIFLNVDFYPFQTLQHGLREREGDVDRSSQEREGKEEV